jgi:hypothetical protein
MLTGLTLHLFCREVKLDRNNFSRQAARELRADIRIPLSLPGKRQGPE